MSSKGNITDKNENGRIIDLTHVVTSQFCNQCNDKMKGPFVKYVKRENELYFDIERKYFHCENCGVEVDVTDFQVLIDQISSMLPPEYARGFSMRNLILFDNHHWAFCHLAYLVANASQKKFVESTLPMRANNNQIRFMRI